jgi:hypothetical protein
VLDDDNSLPTGINDLAGREDVVVPCAPVVAIKVDHGILAAHEVRVIGEHWELRYHLDVPIEREHRYHLDVPIEQLEEAARIVRSILLVQAAHELDVFLRHRLLR